MSSATHQPLGALVFNVTDKTAGKKDVTKAYVGLEHISSGGGSLIGCGSAADSSSTGPFPKSDGTRGGIS
jgi:hypothetical protein